MVPLPRVQEAREALFGGAGYVPDIPALQAWLGACLPVRVVLCVCSAPLWQQPHCQQASAAQPEPVQ